MKIHVLSDLHLEYGPFELPATESDVLVLAGDIHTHTHGLEWAASVAQGKPVVYVLGNHEFYRAHLSGLAVEMKKCASRLGIHLLDNDAVELDGVRFLGTTLWTDFALDGSGDAAVEAMRFADRWMNDFRLIRYGGKRIFTARDSWRLHQAAVAWLATKLAEPYSGPTVVVSHHCPHPESVPERFRGDPLSPAFCSNLEPLILRHGPSLWIHGHTHDSVDYFVGNTRILCNPRGYLGVELNAAFRPDFVVEVPSPQQRVQSGGRGHAGR